MKLTIVYDNDIFDKKKGLKSDWGFSCLIQTEEKNILFDTGAKSKILIHNMHKLNLNPKLIDKIVISHEHWDHNGGLKSLISNTNNVEIFRLESQNSNEKINYNIVKDPQLITNDIHTTGRLIGSPIDEQSLALKGKKGLYILTGCSHPGIEKILENTKQFGNIKGIIGGFHGFKNFSILENLEFICPCHCTKYKKEIKMTFPNVCYGCGVGKIIDI